jgi:hypothetical protein
MKMQPTIHLQSKNIINDVASNELARLDIKMECCIF